MNRENRPKKPRQIKIYPELFSFLNGEGAITISDFINTWVDMCKKGLLDSEGFFEYSRKDVLKRTKIIGYKIQHKILEFLKDLKIIDIKISKKSIGYKSMKTKRLIRIRNLWISTSAKKINNLQDFDVSVKELSIRYNYLINKDKYEEIEDNNKTSKSEGNCLKNKDKEGDRDEKRLQTCIYYIYNILLYYIHNYFFNTYVLKDNTNVLSFNSRILKKDCSDKSEQGIISFFNSLENLRTHNRVRGGRLSKTYIRCEKKIKLLKNGLFYNRHRLNKSFLDKHQIPNPISKKFTDREIMRGFRNLSLLVEDGYGYVAGKKIWPDVGIKEKIKKLSIEDLLFHSVNRNSWFLIALYHKPELICEQLRVPFKEKYLNIFSSILSPDVDLSIKQRLVYTIDSIIKAQDYLIDSNKINWNGMSLGYKGDPGNFLKKYFWFVKDELGIDGGKTRLSFLRNNIRSKSFWNSFCDFLKDEFFLENTEGAKKMFK